MFRLPVWVTFVCALFWSGAVSADLHDLSRHGQMSKIYFIPDAKARDVEVRLFLPVGEVDWTGPEGLAHYLEHLVAWSADKVHGAGLRNRLMNAWTSSYWTSYWNKGSAESFEDMIRHARAVFESVDLSDDFMISERDVVEREFDLRYRGNPIATLYRNARHHLYGTHGLGRSVMGTPETLRQIEPETALAFHKERYRAQDSILLIYGPVSKAEVIEQIEKHLVEIPEPVSVERPIFAPLGDPPEDVLHDVLPDLKRAQVLIMGHAKAPDGLSARRLWTSLILLENVLNGPLDGGLSKPLYYDSFTVTEVGIDIDLLPTGDIGFEIYFSPEDDVDAAMALGEVRAVLDGLAQRGIPEESFLATRSEALAMARRREKARSAYKVEIAQTSLLNLNYALDAKAYHYELGRPGVQDLNAVLRAISGSTFVATAIGEPESVQ